MNIETAQRCLNIAKGCHDYNGGHSGDERDAFHHGVDTVIRCLEELIASNGEGDSQLNAIEAIGRWVE